MCIRRKNRYPYTNQTGSKKTQTSKKKKKAGCCVRCLRKIYGFCCRRIKRRMKKKIYSAVKPNFDDYELTALDLDILKDKTSPIYNRYSFDNVKDTFQSAWDRFDVEELKEKIGSNLNRLSFLNKSVVTLFKNKKKFSKINLSVKNLDLIEGLAFEDLKKKYSIKGSKEKLLEKLVDDYKKGNLSSSGLSNESKFDIKNLDKERLNKMLETYKEKSKDNRRSMAELIVDNLKNKTSLSSNQRGIFEKVLESFKKGDLSKSTTSEIFKLNAKKLSKKQISTIIKKYQEQEKKKGVKFERPSKLEQFKSAAGTYFSKPY